MAVDPKPYADLGRVITDRMKRAQIKQKDLASVVDVDPITVRAWQQGKNLPQGRNLARLVRALETTIEDLWKEAGMDDGRNQMTKIRDRLDRIAADVEAIRSLVDSAETASAQPQDGAAAKAEAGEIVPLDPQRARAGDPQPPRGRPRRT